MKFFLFISLLSLLIVTACKLAPVPNDNSINSAPVFTPLQSDNSGSGKFSRSEKLYLGCWTSTNGNAMSINTTTIQTRNSYHPLSYADVTYDLAIYRRVYLLEIKEPDQSNELMKYVTFELRPQDEMHAEIFDSYKDFENGSPSGILAIWVKTNCDTVRRSLRVSDK